MRRRAQFWYQSKNAKERKEKLIWRSRKGVAAREAKRLANPVEREPKLVVFHPVQVGFRDKLTGDFGWADFKSVRQVTRCAAEIRRNYQPGKANLRVESPLEEEIA